MTGYIYKIVNDVNNQVYVGQTVRDPYIRFDEHCYDNRSTSLIHQKIREIGVSHFKIVEIEHFNNIENLDPLLLNQREAYWVAYYDSYHCGYNMTPDGQGFGLKQYDHIEVIENHLVFDSAEDMGRIISKYTGWSSDYANSRIKDAIRYSKPFLDQYHLMKTTRYVTPIDELEEWARALKVYYCKKMVQLVETGEIFNSQSDAAAFLIKNKYYCKENSISPMQAATTLISRAIKAKQTIELSGKQFTFIDIMARNKQSCTDEPFKCAKIYCPQLQVTFNSQEDMARFIIQNNLWGNITLKTAKLRISDLARGYFKHYKNYQAYNIGSDGQLIIPEYLDGAPGKEVEWIAEESIITAAKIFVNQSSIKDETNF